MRNQVGTAGRGVDAGLDHLDPLVLEQLRVPEHRLVERGAGGHVAGELAQDDDDERSAHRELGDRGPPRRARKERRRVSVTAWP